MSERTDRFRAQQALLAARDPTSIAPRMTSGSQPQHAGSVDSEFLRKLRTPDQPASMDVCQAEVDQLLKHLHDEDAERRLSQLLTDCKRSIVQSIAGPFGLGQITARFDVTGGPVDTIHNAREGIFSTTEAKNEYENRHPYDEHRKGKFHSHRTYIETNNEASCQFKGDGPGVKDAYTGEILKQSHGDKISLDHVIPASKVNDDAGVILAGLDPVAMANKASNLRITSKRVNSSKGAQDADEYANRLINTKTRRKERIQELGAMSNRSTEQNNELEKLTDLDKVSVDSLKKAGHEAHSEYDSVINNTYYHSAAFRRAVAKTSLAEAGRMAKQQAIGALLAEFFVGAVDEIQDWYSSGRQELALGQRLNRVGTRVMNRWKDVLAIGIQGAIAGFLSNIGTVLINVFVTTERRFVRMVREGIMSLVRAVALLVFRPEGMTFKQAAHEASKIALGGGVVIAGVAIEEWVGAQLTAIGLGFVADFAVAIIVGAITGVATALLAYAIDQLDLFGVEAQGESQRVSSLLNTDVTESIAKCEALFGELRSLTVNP